MRQQGEAEERDQRHRDPVRDYEPADIERRRRQQQRHVGPKKQVEEKKAGHRQHPRPRLRRQPWSSVRSEEHTSELQSLMRISYAVFCLKKKNAETQHHTAKLTRQTTITTNTD